MTTLPTFFLAPPMSCLHGATAVLMAMSILSGTSILDDPQKSKVEPIPARVSEATTPEQKLKACAALYASSKTYQDSGAVETVLAGSNRSKRPFSTVYERDGRFLWQYKDSRLPGGAPSHEYFVWSTDQKSFKSFWTLNGELSNHPTLAEAMAGPTGISGGSATLIIPLLTGKIQMKYLTTDVVEPQDAGTEKVDGQMCSVIKGVYKLPPMGDTKVTLWLDERMAIRKVETTKVIDPAQIEGSKGGKPFTAHTTITVTPVFDEKIDDKAFEPPPGAKGK